MKNIYILRQCLILTFLVLCGNIGQAQLAAWDLNGQSSPATFDATLYNTSLDASKALTRGTGAASSTGGNSFRTVGFKNDGVAVTNTDYFECTLSASPGFALSLSTIDARFAGTASFFAAPGVTSRFAYSLDGSTFTMIGSPETSTALIMTQIDLSGIPALQNVPDNATVTIRYYASGQTATGGWGFNSPSAGQYGLAIGGTVNVVVPVPSTTSISPATATAGDPAFTLTVNGSGFIDGSSTVTWNGSSRPTTFISATQLSASIPGTDIASPGSFDVGVTTTGAASSSNTQTFSVNPGTSPSVAVTAPLAGFGSICINTVAGPNSFALDGFNLNGSDITIDAWPGFSYSETSGGIYTNTLSFSYSGNSFTSKTIYVKFSPTAVQAYDGNIAISGGGITGITLAVAGAGINATASVTTGISSVVGATTATVAGSITDAGCSSITDYGIEYSTSTGFPDGTGTKLPASNLSGGNFSVTINGLVPNTRYYYKAYVTTAAGTSYGSQQAFTNTALPVRMSAQSGLSYTEDFADIANWTSFFISGNGANHFSGLSSSGTGTIPSATVITTSTSSFQSGGTSGGVQKGTDQTNPTQSIVLLSTGSGDNSSSAALDLYLDFTGLNAGTLSFDWASIDNSTGNRNASLRVYATVDGVTFSELTPAGVLNFTNNAPTSGSITNIALPAIFNNSATARLRFYFHNGTGGTTGSRPKISIDNLNVSATGTVPCVSPTAPATALNFGTITDVSIEGSFTAASAAADEYLVIASTNSSLISNPADGQVYNTGDNVGDGTVVSIGNSTSFTATGLNESTTYYFFVFPLNSVCIGGPLYYTTTVLTASALTDAGLPPCATPASQPTNLVFGSVTPATVQGSFATTTADEYLVLRSTASALSNNPADGQAYNAGDVIGNATVVQRSNAGSFTASGLTPNTTYYFFVFSIGSQNCVNGPAYNVLAPLSGDQATQPLPPCATPGTQPTSLTLTAANTSISGSFAAGSGADAYIVIRSNTSTLSATPVNSTVYNVGDNIGGGVVVSNSGATNFVATNLTPATLYYFFVFAANENCTGGTKYLISSPLIGNRSTTNAPVNNFYFGTLHSHSDYSDGNQDHPGHTPAMDYDYAMNSQCMDFLGISEHNHYSNTNNPGGTLTNYRLGTTQANNFTATHPGFLALYGMEWGVIQNGGHLLIYGDGMDLLFGWETGSGAWGSTNNYDVFVGKYDYTGANGLFKTVNDLAAQNTFVTLAHPNSGDYNNLANVPYDLVADEAIVGAAVESGPANSTNTSYSQPGSSLSYLGYYRNMLSKGYHLGPTIDHDNHMTTFGRTTYSRTAVVAPALTRSALIKALRNMNYYATQDCDTKVDFTINTRIMGSIFTDRHAPVIAVSLTDATTNVSTAVINLMFGVPGNGNAAQRIATATGSTMTYVDNNLANLTTGYYYLEITNGTARAVTSPIWYTRDDAVTLPVSLISFTAQRANENVRLNWTTASEMNSKEFIVERSVNNGNWVAIAKVPASVNSGSFVNYTTLDQAPGRGINIYRLKMVDKDGSFEHSILRRVNFDTKFSYTIYPNPASATLNIETGNVAGFTAQVLNVQSQPVLAKRFTGNPQTVQLDISMLTPGIYFLKIIAADGSVHMEKFAKR